MIFTIDATVEQIASADDQQIEELLTQLVDADFSGRHFVVINRDICEWAIDNVHLSRRNLQHLVRIFETFAVRGAMLTDAKCITRIVIGNEPVAPVTAPPGFKVGHENINAGEYCSQKATLIVENLGNDAPIYEHVLREALLQTKIPHVEFEAVHAGGSSVADIFKSEIEKNRIVLCIVDSDMSAPCDREGNSCKKVLRIEKERNVDLKAGTQSFIGAAFKTVGRELENFLPYYIVKSLPQYAAHSSLDELDKLVDQNGAKTAEECLWLFFDVKKGLDGAELLKKLEGENISSEVVDWVCKMLGINVDDIKGVRIEGFGEKVAANFLKSDQAKSEYHHFVRSKYWRSLYFEYFEKILWFFVAAPRTRT